MRLKGLWLAVAAGLALGLVASAWAQPGPAGSPGVGQGRYGGAGRKFNPQTVETLTGLVGDINRVGSQEGRQRVRLTLHTPQETVVVHLGPARFLDAQNFSLTAGNQITVTGSRVTTRRGRAVIIAQEVTSGSQVLRLRDANGVPLWRGQRGPAN
jgi:hypothetical protein